ncbi:MAG TPA: YHYH protein, partial [Bacteroidia bacterium]|nr:YHYH protein [Bacteroidia bacterium]
SQTNTNQGQHVWNVDAWYGEGFTLDTAFSAHPQQDGAYHSHATPHRLYDFPSTSHSPIVGFAFDGYPIYGPYGYTNPNNASGGVSRMESSYQLRNITTRQILPDGTVLQPQEYGPTVSGTHPLGEYIEDYEYVSGLGDLDANNGRTCVTPEYPGGTYAYFVAADANGDPVYPYYIGAEYHGTLDDDNLNPNATITIPVGVTCLSGITSIVDNQPLEMQAVAAPSVVDDRFSLSWGNAKIDRLMVIDGTGRILCDQIQPKGGKMDFISTDWAAGIYHCQLITGSATHALKIVVQH